MYHCEEKLCAAVLYRENRVVWVILRYWVIISGKTHSCWFYQAAKQTSIIQIHNRNGTILGTQLLCWPWLTAGRHHPPICPDWRELRTLPGNPQWHAATLWCHVSCAEHRSVRAVLTSLPRSAATITPCPWCWLAEITTSSALSIDAVWDCSSWSITWLRFLSEIIPTFERCFGNSENRKKGS